MDNLKYYETAVKALELSDEELYLELGVDLDDDNHAFPLPPKKLIENAKNWLRNNLDRLQEKICQDVNVRNNVEGEMPLLIAVLADIVAAHWNLVNPVTAATLITRAGITKFCKSKWE